MARIHRTPRGSWLAFALVVVLVVPTLVAAAQPRQKKLKAGQYNPADRTVEMFKAMKAGDIEVKLIPKDSTQARVFIANKTKEPLNVRLPDVFAGVPVLAQAPGGGALPGGGGGHGGNDHGGGNTGSQGMGGGMGGMGMGGMGGGMWNVKPENVGNFKVPVVCLEHGKHDPRPNIRYVIKPLEEFTDNPEVREVCKMLGTGRVNQRAAQAAAWHFANGMSWQQLATKSIHSLDGSDRPYFSPAELRVAMELASAATRLAKEQPKKPDPKSDSLSTRYAQ
jgi:hypothetical protein